MTSKTDQPIQLTLFSVASHALHSPVPGSKEAERMTVTSGQKLYEQYVFFAPELSCWKTLLDSSRWNSILFLLTWKAQVTPQHRLLFRLRLLEPHTDATACLSWPTLKASTNRETSGSLTRTKFAGPQLQQAIELQAGILPREFQSESELSPVARRMLGSAWPTLTAHDTAMRQTKYAQGGTPITLAVSRALPKATLTSSDSRGQTRSPDAKQKQTHLDHQVRVSPWATLQSRDYRSGEPEGSLRSQRKAEEGWSSNLNDEVRAYPTLTSRDYRSGADRPSRTGAVSRAKLLTYPTPTANRRSGLQSHGKNAFLGQLNPEWCEMLQGFPPGWTDIGTSGPHPLGFLSIPGSQIARAQGTEVARHELRRLEMRGCRNLRSCSLRHFTHTSKKQISKQVSAELKRRRMRTL